MICTMGELNRGVTKSLLQPVLPTFTEALVSSLNLPDDSHLSDVGLKTEVLKGRQTTTSLTATTTSDTCFSRIIVPQETRLHHTWPIRVGVFLRWPTPASFLFIFVFSYRKFN